MFEGVGTYPDASRMWQIVDKYKVSLFYTAPTAIRALMALGKSWVEKYSRKTLRVLGSVGEPINPEAWLWFHEVVGNSKCEIVDTFWQTETGLDLIDLFS
jgi:acetyl-CoA synthetase